MAFIKKAAKYELLFTLKESNRRIYIFYMWLYYTFIVRIEAFFFYFEPDLWPLFSAQMYNVNVKILLSSKLNKTLLLLLSLKPVGDLRWKLLDF